jgi:hypothetical protein
LKAPGFKPGAYKVINCCQSLVSKLGFEAWFQSLLSNATCAVYAEALRAHPSLLLLAPAAAVLAFVVNAALLYPPVLAAYRHGGYGPNPSAIMPAQGGASAAIGGGSSGGGGGGLALSINGGGGSSNGYSCEPRYPDTADVDENGALMTVPCCVHTVPTWVYYHGAVASMAGLSLPACVRYVHSGHV